MQAGGGAASLGPLLTATGSRARTLANRGVSNSLDSGGGERNRSGADRTRSSRGSSPLPFSAAAAVALFGFCTPRSLHSCAAGQRIQSFVATRC